MTLNYFSPTEETQQHTTSYTQVQNQPNSFKSELNINAHHARWYVCKLLIIHFYFILVFAKWTLAQTSVDVV